MLVATSLLSYGLYRLLNRKRKSPPPPPASDLRAYYYEMRRRARDMAAEYDLTDEEIEARIQKELEERK